MVQINKLGKPNVAGTPRPAAEKEKQTITAKDVGQVPAGLIESKSNAQITAIPKNLNLPAFLTQVEMPETAERDFGGYIGFASTNSPNWAQMALAGLREGQPFAHIEKTYYPLPQVNFFLCRGESFQTCIVGKEGNIKFATRDMQANGPTFGTNRTDPHYVILMIVEINGQFVPIKGDFKGTKAGGCEGAIAAVRAAADPEWLKLSDAHKVTAAFPQPFGRVYHQMTTKYEVSKSTGNPYYRTMCQSTPTTVSKMQELLEALQNEEFMQALEKANDNFNQRVKFLDDMCQRFANPQAAQPGQPPAGN